MKLVTAAEMRELDRRTIEDVGVPSAVLMENAGRSTYQILRREFAELSGPVVILAGRGNNGGDGFVIARYLKQKGLAVSVYLLADSGKVQGDAAANLRFLKPLNIPLVELPDAASFSRIKSELSGLDVWVDALLGTGLKSDVKGYFKTVIEFINELDKPVFAVDIPSGLNSDTGQACGACIRARATATFAFAKIGHMVYPGADLTGALEIVDIGIPSPIVEAVRPRQFLLTAQLIRSCFKPRPPDAHKGRTGHLLVIAGSTGKTGAASMTCHSALRAGAGLVTLGIAESLNPILEAGPELSPNLPPLQLKT